MVRVVGRTQAGANQGPGIRRQGGVTKSPRRLGLIPLVPDPLSVRIPSACPVFFHPAETKRCRRHAGKGSLHQHVFMRSDGQGIRSAIQQSSSPQNKNV